jgi:sugar phosphate isomerase/epimerase
MEQPYAFPLEYQTVLTPDYRTDQETLQNFSLLQELKFSGVELNITEPKQIDVKDLKDFLAGFELVMGQFASGLAAKTFNLSLSSPDPNHRKAFVDQCKTYIDFAAAFDAGVILGYAKGGVSSDPAAARWAYKESLKELVAHAEKTSTPILTEATNRYETSVANSLDETYDLIKDFENSCARILPDTFHMNIEEKDMLGALKIYADRYQLFHFSDNNRFLPGLGAIDFQPIVEFLKENQYQGWIGLEGNIQDNVRDDLRATMKYLGPVLE